MSSLNSKNLFDAGASSATKNTDLADGIFEDVSSDLSREHGPGGEKKPYSFGGVAGTGIGTKGGVLDNIGGSPHKLGNDAQTLSGSSLITGTSSATKGTNVGQGVQENLSKAGDSIKGAGQKLGDASANGLGGQGAGSSTLSSGGGLSLLDRVKENISGLVGKDTASQGMQQGAAGGLKNTDFTEGVTEDAPDGKSSIKSALTALNK